MHPFWMHRFFNMPITLTIKGVPDAIAEALRQRAQANHRSLQKELLLIAEEAAGVRNPRVAEPALPAYGLFQRGTRAKPPEEGRLTLEQLWQRARKLGPASASEAAALVRADRDARHRR